MSDREDRTGLRPSAAVCLACAAALLAASAWPQQPRALPSTAQPVGAAGTAATAAEIQRINEQMALLQAQLNQLELQARIAAKKKEIQGAAAGATGPGAAALPDGGQGTPAVLSVAGLQGELEAVLVFPGGLTQRVRAGDVIDQRRVARVARNEVVLTDLQGRKTQRLAFGSVPPTREAAPTANPPAPLPLLPSPPLGR